MRLLETHSHTPEQQGYEADKERQETRERNNTSTKAIAIPTAGEAWGANLFTETRKVEPKRVIQS